MNEGHQKFFVWNRQDSQKEAEDANTNANANTTETARVKQGPNRRADASVNTKITRNKNANKGHKKLVAGILALALCIPTVVFAAGEEDLSTGKKPASTLQEKETGKAKEPREKESKDAPTYAAPKAADNKEEGQAKFAKQILTYDFVLAKAVADSPELESYRFKKEQVDQQIDANAKGLFDLMPAANAGSAQAQAAMAQAVVQAQVLQTQGEIHEESKHYTLESLKVAIRQIFNSVESAQQTIALQKRKLDFLRKFDQITDLRLKLGLVSAYDSQKAKDELKMEEQSLKEMEAKLKNDMLDLNKYVRVQDIQQYTIEPIAVTYALLEQSTEQVDTRATQASYLDVAVFSKRQALKVKEVLLDQRMYTTTKAIDQADFRVQQSDLSTLQKQTKNSILDLYQKMNLLGQNIVTEEMELGNQEKELSNLQLLLSKGNAAQTDVDKANLALDTLKLSIKEKKKQYESLKLLYQNPYIGASFSEGAASSGR